MSWRERGFPRHKIFSKVNLSLVRDDAIHWGVACWHRLHMNPGAYMVIANLSCKT